MFDFCWLCSTHNRRTNFREVCRVVGCQYYFPQWHIIPQFSFSDLGSLYFVLREKTRRDARLAESCIYRPDIGGINARYFRQWHRHRYDTRMSYAKDRRIAFGRCRPVATCYWHDSNDGSEPREYMDERAPVQFSLRKIACRTRRAILQLSSRSFVAVSETSVPPSVG